MADLTPDQTQGPSWGSIAMPQMPSTLAFYSPGLQVMGGLAADTAFNAKRAQNLAAFDAFQKMNPNATAADLSAAAEHITGGDSLLGGSFTPAVMQDIANKNRLTLQSQQAKEQGEITATFLTAMQQSIDTANTPEEWVQKAKALMPQSSWQAFDAYMGPKNTQDMFKVYQQRRVGPAVKDGIDFMWDTPDKYTTALGGNETLGKMAYDLAKPQVDAKKAEAAQKAALVGAQTSEAQAGAAERVAAAQTQRVAAQTEQAHAKLYEQETQDAKTKGNLDRKTFWDEKVMGDGFTRTAFASGNTVDLQKAHDIQLNEWRSAFGTDYDDEFERRWKGGDATLAGQVSQAATARAKQHALDMMTTVMQPETDALKSAVAPDNPALAANGTDTAILGTLEGDAKTAATQRAISLTRGLLASKEMVTTDMVGMKRIIAQDIKDGKNDDQIKYDLMNTIGSKGYPVYGPGSAIQSAIAFDTPGIHAAVNTGDMLGQVDNNVKDAKEQVETVMGQLLGKPVRGQVQKPQGDVIGDAKRVNAVVNKNLADINRIIFELQDPDLKGEYWGKQDKPAALATLLQQQRDLKEKSDQLARMLGNRPDLTAEGKANTTVNVNGTDYTISTDTSTVDAGLVGRMPALVANVAKPGQPMVDGGYTTYDQVFDPKFVEVMNSDVNLQRLAAVTTNEAKRLLATAGQAAAQAPATLKTFGAAVTKPPITKLAPRDIKALVEKEILANKGMMDGDPVAMGKVQTNLETFIMRQQQLGLLGP